jgi:hypothetical protein
MHRRKMERVMVEAKYVFPCLLPPETDQFTSGRRAVDIGNGSPSIWFHAIDCLHLFCLFWRGYR